MDSRKRRNMDITSADSLAIFVSLRPMGHIVGGRALEGEPHISRDRACSPLGGQDAVSWRKVDHGRTMRPFLLSMLIVAASTSAIGDTLFLECTVSGKVSVTIISGESPPDEKLAQATVRVEIDHNGKSLRIEIDGPPDYGESLDSATSDGVVASADAFALHTVSSSPGLTEDRSILVKRKTGTFSVLKTYIIPQRSAKQISYSGTCQKMSSANKF
jgi:hypothetical protein